MSKAIFATMFQKVVSSQAVPIANSVNLGVQSGLPAGAIQAGSFEDAAAAAARASNSFRLAIRLLNAPKQ